MKFIRAFLRCELPLTPTIERINCICFVVSMVGLIALVLVIGMS